MADWSLLRSALGRVEQSVRYTWDELDSLVGGLPASATNHRAWWSGNRSHVNAWRLAGFTISDLVMGQEVTFVRTSTAPHLAATEQLAQVSRPVPRADPAQINKANAPTLLLIACVKEKRPAPSAAKDLYVSPLFKKERVFAERSGLPWFILSAEHGLVAPDEWLAPYERYLPDTPKDFRTAWGMWVAERLELLTGSLQGRTIEVHAGSAYVEALRAPFASKGAALVDTLAGLTMGHRLAWYRDRAPEHQPHAEATPNGTSHLSTDWFCDQLTHEAVGLSPKDFLARGPSGLKVPGLYSWWVDSGGASELATGLGHPLNPGLIYAGLAGATRWPSGRQSSNTLWSRITGMHLGGRHEFSTFRRTLGSILANARGQATIDEDRLTAWMNAHLKVIAVPFPDPDALGQLEQDVLGRLDPPLNLKGMADSVVRRRLKALRRPHARKKRGSS